VSPQRRYTYPEVVSLLFSGKNDHLTGAEFRAKYPLVELDADDPATLPADSFAGPDGSVSYMGLENAILFDNLEFSMVAAMRNGERDDKAAIAIKVQGRVNKRDERASVLLLTNADGLAALVIEALGLADRCGKDYRDAVFRRVVDLAKRQLSEAAQETAEAVEEVVER
jgi:hypothetical protein